ncbi:MAG: 3-hydroxyacyl-ACP dehydratase FabZ [Kiritimatiellae bacterium]|nr:3-hydroxyacyl-ACP dehydratase FabZ [Kiritimatiellia bacterium]
MKDIKELLPHREPFLFVDRLVSRDDASAVGEYTFTAEKDGFFRGHFPGNPIVPGVILVESMAQVCAASVVAGGSFGGRTPLFYLAAVSDVRFLRPVRPGDTLVTRARNGRGRGRYCSFEAEGFVGGEKVVKATLKCIVEA